jgi:predicted negative regulator of RcsB-dependent stress response
MKQFLKNRPVKILLIILAVLAGITLVGWLYYESQRPNYNDLQKAYSQLEIPSDWKLVSQSDNKGTW